MKELQCILSGAIDNPFFRCVIIAIVFDTILGVLRAIKEHKFNSCFGIDGAIRKCSMLVSIVFLVLVDYLVHINLIGFLPETLRTYIHISQIGIAEFFAILYIAYETVSILKNMTLCGLPVKKIWIYVRTFLLKYTDELPDTDGLEEKDNGKKEISNSNS